MVRPKKRGNQKPTFSTVGDWAYSDGEYAVEMFRNYGVNFYESQEYEMHVFLARNEDGSYSATTICISKPRQNGKSFATRHYAIWMAAIEGKRVLFSAHHGKTVRKMFKEIKDLITKTPDLVELLMPNGKGIYSAAGSEGIYFVDEYGNPCGCIEFQTRTNSAARGETYQVIIIDEAQELTDDQLEAIQPTMLAASSVDEPDSDPQMIFLGTPPGPKCPGTVFRDLHDRAHDGTGGGVWWMEWAVEEVPDMSDREAVMELVYETNPAMGYRIKEKTMLDAMDKMRPDGFARECLGWWSKAAVALRLISAEAWSKCKTARPPADGLKVYAVKFSPDGMSGALAVCLRPKDGKPYVEIVKIFSMADGLEWLVEWLVERKGTAANIVIDGKSYAQALNDSLLERGVVPLALVLPKTGDVIAACSTMVDSVKTGSIEHYGQPDLDDSACFSSKRKIGNGGGFGFESNSKADATLIEACALALWKALTTKRNPTRKMRCG